MEGYYYTELKSEIISGKESQYFSHRKIPSFFSRIAQSATTTTSSTTKITPSIQDVKSSCTSPTVAASNTSGGGGDPTVLTGDGAGPNGSCGGATTPCLFWKVLL
jgi:hypothetical protein